MFGDKFNLGNIASLMKNAGKIQDMMKDAQAQLAKIKVTGESGAGLVKITVNAEGYAQSVEIDPSVLSEDKEILQDLIAAAINDATQKVQKMKEKMLSSNDILGGILGDKEK